MPSDEPIERQLARFFDLSDDLLCVAGLDGYFRRINPAFTRVLGHTALDLLSRPLIEFVHPDDRAATQDEMARLQAGQPVVEFRNRYLTADGGTRWLEWAARAVPGEGVVYAIARDVTARVEMDRELLAREARERALLDNTTAVIYVKDQQCRYEFVNEQFARLFGVTRESVRGKSDFDLFPPDHAQGFRVNDERVLRTGETVQVEELAPHADGPHTYVSVKFPLFDGSGAVRSVAGISTDITDRLRAQDAEEQFRLAWQVQQRLYPAAAPTVAGFDIAGQAVSASQLCGDYFDFVPRGDGRLVAAVGDVSGHGLGPALHMVETRALLRLLLQTPAELPDVLARLNHHLYRDTPDGSFVSLVLAELDPAARTLTHAGAGHDAHLLRSAGRAVRLGSTGPVLGVADPEPFDAVAGIRLAPGDVLVLVTDGVSEAMSPHDEPYGVGRVVEAVARLRTMSAATVVDGLFADVRAFTAGQPVRDDMSVIVVKAL